MTLSGKPAIATRGRLAQPMTEMRCSREGLLVSVSVARWNPQSRFDSGLGL